MVVVSTNQESPTRTILEIEVPADEVSRAGCADVILDHGSVRLSWQLRTEKSVIDQSISVQAVVQHHRGRELRGAVGAMQQGHFD